MYCNHTCMSVTDDSVRDRIETAGVALTPTQALAALALAAVIGFTLLVVQEPLVHDALHDFRHAVGITCH